MPAPPIDGRSLYRFRRSTMDVFSLRARLTVGGGELPLCHVYGSLTLPKAARKFCQGSIHVKSGDSGDRDGREAILGGRFTVFGQCVGAGARSDQGGTKALSAGLRE